MYPCDTYVVCKILFPFAGVTESVTVGFSVIPSKSRYYTCPDFETVVFDTVTTDVTNSFDVIGSRFTCPVTGVYMFTLTIRNGSGYYARGDVMLEAMAKAVVNSNDGTAQHDHNQATNSVIFAGRRTRLGSK